MKLSLLLPFLAIACYAGDMVETTVLDFKKPSAWYVEHLDEMRAGLDLSKEGDRRAMDRFEQQMYIEAVMKVADPFFRSTRLAKGDDWKQLWIKRQIMALEEVGDDRLAHDSLRKALSKLSDFIDDRDATILERVVRAKFGDDEAWILLVHWERADVVANEQASETGATLGHYLIVAVRASDQKILAVAMCG